MMFYLRSLVIVLFAASLNAYPQIYEPIEEASARYFINLANKDTGEGGNLLKLKAVLLNNYDQQELESVYGVSQADYEILKNHFYEYEAAVKNISVDSALVLFNQWYLQFSNTFYTYSSKRFFSTYKEKILFFSASLSCQCTLELCRKQTVEILNLVRVKNLAYWVVDSYEHNDLQIKYETYFAPSLILFNALNDVRLKIEYEENLLFKLNQFLN
jgi:hypothetical protein